MSTDPFPRLTEMLVEDILATPDDEILAEAEAEGVDLDRFSAEMRALVDHINRKSVV